ncbi:MAG: NAD-dependent dehydratase, partial [Actinomycetota bacterium]|nr:NAD-dependent dehydratase [Actinomycetota bacterium]
LRVQLPERVAVRLAHLRHRWGIGATPPELLPFLVHPWVVANDRLKADGWTPASTNEEAFVASHKPGPWQTLSPTRRQELALGVAGATIVGAVAAAVVVVRRRRRR